MRGAKRWAATVAGERCAFGHTTRYASNGRCVECAITYWSRKYTEDPEKFRARARAAYRADPTKRKATMKQWKQAHAEQVREYNRQARSKYVEKNRASIRERDRARRRAQADAYAKKLR